MKNFVVRFTEEAEADLLRLFDYQLERNILTAELARQAIAKSIELLEIFPFSCRKAGGGARDPFLRELIIPFGNSGYVALFEIEAEGYVTILVVRHQREDDYH
jgi:plasmid stabilization system protein ParE